MKKLLLIGLSLCSFQYAFADSRLINYYFILRTTNTFNAPETFLSSTTFSSSTIQIGQMVYFWPSSAPATGDSVLHYNWVSSRVYFGGDGGGSGGGGGGGGGWIYDGTSNNTFSTFTVIGASYDFSNGIASITVTASGGTAIGYASIFSTNVVTNSDRADTPHPIIISTNNLQAGTTIYTSSGTVLDLTAKTRFRSFGSSDTLGNSSFPLGGVFSQGSWHLGGDKFTGPYRRSAQQIGWSVGTADGSGGGAEVWYYSSAGINIYTSGSLTVGNSAVSSNDITRGGVSYNTFRDTTSARITDLSVSTASIGSNLGSHVSTRTLVLPFGIEASSGVFSSSLTVRDVIISSAGALLGPTTFQGILNVQGGNLDIDGQSANSGMTIYYDKPGIPTLYTGLRQLGAAGTFISISGAGAGYDTFHINNEGGERLTILSGGNVGIGATAPSSKFDIVDGSVTISGANAGVQIGGVSLMNALSTMTTTLGLTSIGFTFDGGGSAVVPSTGFAFADFGGTVTGWTVVADSTGTIVINVKKCAGFICNPVTSIAGTEKPTITSDWAAQDYSLSSWTTAFAAGDKFSFNVDENATITRASVYLRVQK